MPTRNPLRFAAGAALAAACVACAASPAGARSVTNSELVGQALHAAADSLLSGLPAVKQAHLVVLPANGQEPQWGVENELAGRLAGVVARVTFHGALGDTTTGPAPADTGAAQQARPRASVVDHRPIDPEAALLEYRVATLGVTYTDVHKARIFGASEVERSAQVSLAARLLGPDGRMLWSGRAVSVSRDRVPQDDLPEVEDNLYSFARPTLPSADITRILEPAIVVALVSGLVFLFYTNRN